MSEVLNKYGVLKSSKTTDNDSKVESLHSKNKDDPKTSNTLGTSIEEQKEVIEMEIISFISYGLNFLLSEYISDFDLNIKNLVWLS